MGVELFTNEERILINSICENEKLSVLTKDTVVKSLVFSQQIAGDDDVEDLVGDAARKIRGLTESEWNELKMLIPFPVAMVAEDDVSEVPDDEELVV